MNERNCFLALNKRTVGRDEGFASMKSWQLPITLITLRIEI
jgi:hypothetical protein